jgi:hypothetical protein
MELCWCSGRPVSQMVARFLDLRRSSVSSSVAPIARARPNRIVPIARPIQFSHEAAITQFHSNRGGCPRLVHPMPSAVTIAASRSPDGVFARSAHHIPIASLHPTPVLRADYDRCLSRSKRMTNASHATAELLGTEASHFAFPFLLDPYRNDGECVSQFRDRRGKFKSSNSR